MASSKNGVHILAFPFPAQGHMLPLLDLAYQLSLRGLTVTILVTPRNLPILNPLLSADNSIQTLVLPFPSCPEVPEGVENVKDTGNLGNIPIIKALSQLKDPIIQWFNSQSSPPVAILSDFFLGWTHDLSLLLKVPRITFYTSGAFVIAVGDHLWENIESIEPECDITFHDLPRAPCFTYGELPSVFRRTRKSLISNPNDDSVKNAMIANSLSWASVFNTFHSLEDEFLNYLMKKTSNPRLYSIGPLHLLDGYDEKLGCGTEVLPWLDQCKDQSVLYVCFGSQKLLNNAQIAALAESLENSGVKFIWVVKSATARQMEEGYGKIPDGFEERVKGQGYVFKGWAPQSLILSHRAVGGFLSHCGWNSLLEAVASGVLLLCWPMEADQFIDAKLMVEYKGAAIRVCEGDDNVPDSAKLARVIAESMRGDVIERQRAKELKDKAIDAVKVGGSSYQDLDNLVQEIVALKIIKMNKF